MIVSKHETKNLTSDNLLKLRVFNCLLKFFSHQKLIQQIIKVQLNINNLTTKAPENLYYFMFVYLLINK